MSNLFSRRFVTAILALLIVGSMSHTLSQSQSKTLSDEDEAEILESLIQLETKQLGGEFGPVRYFSSENIGSLSASRITKHGFWLISPGDIQTRKRDYLLNYVVIRSIHPKDGIVVVRVSVVTEGRPCSAPAFSTERSFTYWFTKTANEWIGRLVKGPSPFLFSKSMRTPTVHPLK
jgi:hypothetical protein